MTTLMVHEITQGLTATVDMDQASYSEISWPYLEQQSYSIPQAHYSTILSSYIHRQTMAVVEGEFVYAGWRAPL